MNNDSSVNTPKPLENKKMSRKERRHTNFPHNPVKGRALYKWSNFFFVLTCIGTALAGITLALPVFITILSVLSVLVWLLFIVFVSIFTLFTIWANEDAKTFVHEWQLFNEKLFDSSKNADEFAKSVIPIFLIVGAVIILITWLFTIIGRCTDTERKKKYLGKIIALSIITLLYIVFLIINFIVRT